MVTISDHAIIWWLERVKGIDMERVRAEMDCPALSVADAFGAPVVIGRNGERYVVRNGIIVTTIAKSRHAGRTIAR